MRKTFFAIFTACLVMIIGCGKPSKEIIQPECYTKQEVDQKIDSLRQEFIRAEDSMVVVKEEIVGLRDAVNENRDEFQYKMGSWEKDITCERCGNTFTVKDKRKVTFGPLIGIPQPPEITW